jgi:hypothetical protein
LHRKGGLGLWKDVNVKKNTKNIVLIDMFQKKVGKEQNYRGFVIMVSERTESTAQGDMGDCPNSWCNGYLVAISGEGLRPCNQCQKCGQLFNK